MSAGAVVPTGTTKFVDSESNPNQAVCPPAAVAAAAAAAAAAMIWRDPVPVCVDPQTLLNKYNTRRRQRQPASPPLSFTTTQTTTSPITPLVLLPSYPRSGNTLLRTYLEELLLAPTGSDTRPDRNLSLRLSGQMPHEPTSSSGRGFVGEGVTSGVRVVKTHYPERSGWGKMQIPTCSKIILLVRNPFDTIDSYFNLCLTNSHSESLHQNVYEHFEEFFDRFKIAEVGVWAKFNEFWMSKRRGGGGLLGGGVGGGGGGGEGGGGGGGLHGRAF